MNYSLTVLDLRDGAVLVPPRPQSSWPILPELSAIRVDHPVWPGPLLPAGAAPVLRAEIAVSHDDGRSTLRQEWIGYWTGDAANGVLGWREAEDDPVPMRVVISAGLDGFCVWDQYGAGLSLLDDFPGVSRIMELERELVSWAGAYDHAYAACNGVREGMHIDWDRFNLNGLELARRLKVLLGERAVVFYEKAPYDATRPTDETQLVE